MGQGREAEHSFFLIGCQLDEPGATRPEGAPTVLWANERAIKLLSANGLALGADLFDLLPEQTSSGLGEKLRSAFHEWQRVSIDLSIKGLGARAVPVRFTRLDNLMVMSFASQSASALMEADPGINPADILKAMETTGQGVFCWQIGAPIIAINPQAAMLLSLSGGGHVHTDQVFDILHPEDRRTISRALVEQLTGKAEKFEATFRVRCDLEWSTLLVEACALKVDETGVPTVIAGTVTNVSAVMENSTLGMGQDLPDRTMADAAVLTAVRQEMRAPLAEIVSLCHMMGAQQLGVQQRTYLDLIKRAANKTLVQIDQLSALAEGSPKEDGEAIEDFHLRTVIEQAMFGWAALIEDRQHRLNVRLPAVLPTIVKGNAKALRKIVSGLLGVVVSEPSAALIDVRFGARTLDDGTIRLRIDIQRQNQAGGAGFAEGRAGGVAVVDGQPGLGGENNPTFQMLVSLVRSHGGTAGLRDLPGGGTGYWATILLQPVDGVEELPTVDGVAEGAKPLRRILIAEDEAVSQLLIVALMEKLGFSLDVVSNGADAVEAFRGEDYDAVLLDIHMPEMDGLAAGKAILALMQDRRKVPLVALTADISPAVHQGALAAGFSDFLVKPISLASLSKALGMLVEPDALSA